MPQTELDIIYPAVVKSSISGKYAIEYFHKKTQRYYVSDLEFTEKEDAEKIVQNILMKKEIPSNF